MDDDVIDSVRKLTDGCDTDADADAIPCAGRVETQSKDAKFCVSTTKYPSGILSLL
jgi:hypothetical protein